MRTHPTPGQGLPCQRERGLPGFGSAGRNGHHRQFKTPVRQSAPEGERAVRTQGDRTPRKGDPSPRLRTAEDHHLGVHPEPEVVLPARARGRKAHRRRRDSLGGGDSKALLRRRGPIPCPSRLRSPRSTVQGQLGTPRSRDRRGPLIDEAIEESRGDSGPQPRVPGRCILPARRIARRKWRQRNRTGRGPTLPLTVDRAHADLRDVDGCGRRILQEEKTPIGRQWAGSQHGIGLDGRLEPPFGWRRDGHRGPARLLPTEDQGSRITAREPDGRRGRARRESPSIER